MKTKKTSAKKTSHQPEASIVGTGASGHLPVRDPTTTPSASPAASAPPSGGATATGTPTGGVAGTSTRSKAKPQLVNQLLLLIAALEASFASTDTMVLPSGTYSIEELTQAFTALVTAIKDVAQVTEAYHQKVESAAPLIKSTLSLRQQVKGVIGARVGQTSRLMASYGFAPQKDRPVKPVVRVAAAAKGRSTREARGT
jgi:hypothetical protein